MASTSVSTLVIFIAAVSVAAGVSGVLVDTVGGIADSVDQKGVDVANQIDTDVEIITDLGSDATEPVVLIAEDQRRLADLFTSVLTDDYEVRTAYDGETAIELHDPDVDVVLLDRNMPDTSGDEVLQHVCNAPGTCGVAMITAVEPALDIADMRFDEYIVKPIDIDELGSLVETLRQRTACDEVLQRHYRLTSKIALLEKHLHAAELAASEEYQHLQAELTEIDRTMSGTVDDLDSADVGAILRSDSHT